IGGVADGNTPWSVTTLAIDTAPDPFTFTDQTGVALSTPITSNTITVTGINSPATFSLTGLCTVKINAGAFGAAPATVALNDTVTLQVTSSASNNTAVTCAVTIGGVADGNTPWSVTTLASVCATGTTTTFSSGAINLPVPAGGGSVTTASHTIVVGAAYSACLIADLNVTVTATKHFTDPNYPVDWSIRMTYPEGTIEHIMDSLPWNDVPLPSRGGSLPGIIFDDEGATPFATWNDIANWPLTSGQSLIPATTTILTVLDGSSPVGNWTMKVGDYTDGSPGNLETFNSWSITITWQ
ncbi:MAG: hypothetical protein OEZ55_08850, partial [Nitrospinota bacterium]|nr:hypothetical protein [Nitrospinota bacterium]